MAQSQVTIRADLSQLRKDIAASAGLTEDQAKGMIISLERRLKAAEKASKDAARANRDLAKATEAAAKAAAAAEKSGQKVASGWGAAAKALQQNQLVAELETVLALGIQVGGTFSQLAMVATSLVRPVALLVATMGPLGAGMAASVVQAGLWVGIVNKAIDTAYGLADAAVKAKGRLADFNVQVSPAAARDIAAYELANRSLAAAFDELAVKAGAPVAGELALFVQTLAETVDGVADAALALNDFGDRVVDRFLPPIGLARDAIRWGEKSLWHALTDSQRAALDLAAAAMAASEEVARLNPKVLKGYQDEREALLALGMVYDDSDEAERKRKKEAQEAARLRAEALRKEEEAWRDLLDTSNMPMGEDLKTLDADQILGWARATVEAEQELADLERRLPAVIADLEAFGAEMEKFGKDWEKKQKERQAAIDATIEAGAQASVDVMNAAFDAIDMRQQERLDAAMDAYDRQRDRARTYGEEIRDIEAEIEETHSASVRTQLVQDMYALQERRKHARAQARDRKKAALEAWQDNQEMQVAQTTLNALATFGMVMANTPAPPPFNFLLAGASAAAVEAQIIPIAAASPPSFHTGTASAQGSGNEFPAVLERGEVVLDKRVGAEMGEGTTNALNAGLPLEVTVVNNIHVDSMQVAQVVKKHLMRASAGRRNLNTAR